MPPHPITIVAHRGLHHALPENSMEAFTAAWNSGIHWCECDIHFSADGHPVIIHDETLDRTTTATGNVAERSFADLQSLALRDAAGAATHCRLPGLHAVLDAMPSSCSLLIEFKQLLPTDFLTDLFGRIGAFRVAYQSFHEADMPLFEKALPQREFSWLLDTAPDIDAALDSPWPSLHINHKSLDAARAAKIRAAGKTFGVWTVNDEAALRRAAALGPSMIITDEPRLALSLLADKTNSSKPGT